MKDTDVLSVQVVRQTDFVHESLQIELARVGNLLDVWFVGDPHVKGSLLRPHHY